MSVYFHTACSYPGCKPEDVTNCEDAVRDHKRYAKWHQMKQAVIVLSDDDDEDDIAAATKPGVASPTTKVRPHPPMFFTSSATCLLQRLRTDLTDETRKEAHETPPVVQVPNETQPVVPIFKADWHDFGIGTTQDGGTCTTDACNSLVAAGALAGSYVLKKIELDGDASVPGTMWDSEALQAFRDDPAKMAKDYRAFRPNTDDLEYMMCRNNEVKNALKHWFDTDSIEVLSVDTSKKKKTQKKTQIQPKNKTQKPHTFVSAL